MNEYEKRILCHCGRRFAEWDDYEAHIETAADGERHSPEDW